MATPEEVAGQEVRHLRTARGWSQEELAERMKAYGYDWHQTLVGRIEAAQRPLRLNEAVDLAALFGISIETLLTRTQREVDVEKLRIEMEQARMELERAEEALSMARQEFDRAREVEQRLAARLHDNEAEARAATARLASLDRALRQALGRTPPERPA